MTTTWIKWVSVPALLIGALFSRFAFDYELLLNTVVCLGATVVIQRAISVREYFWAAGFVAVAVVFSPLVLAVKIFVLLCFTSFAAVATVLAAWKKQPTHRAVTALLTLALTAAIPAACTAQTADALEVSGKLRFHAEKTLAPTAIAGFAAYAGLLQEFNSPKEWGQGGAAYGKRFASTMGASGIHSALAFGLDSTLHQDPRYYRSDSTGFWRRAAHALRGTILTRTDSGGETVSTWRIGSAYGAAFLSNQWHPDRVNTTRLGLIQGTAGLGFDLAGNLGSEFWPDIKRKIFRRK